MRGLAQHYTAHRADNATSALSDFTYWKSTEQANQFREAFAPEILEMEFRLAELENPVRQHGVQLGHVAIVDGHPVDGNSGRNILDAPGLRDVDLALAWTLQLSERINLQFRAEASNAFNIVSLGMPGTNVSAPSSFGIIRSAQPMRQLQLGLRLLF